MLIVAAFCIALNVTLQEVGEHDLVDLRFGRFQSLEAFGGFGVHGCNTRHKNERVRKTCPGEVEQLFLFQHLSIFQWILRSSNWNIFCKVSIAKSDLSAWRREIISCHVFSMQRRELSASSNLGFIFGTFWLFHAFPTYGDSIHNDAQSEALWGTFLGCTRRFTPWRTVKFLLFASVSRGGLVCWAEWKTLSSRNIIAWQTMSWLKLPKGLLHRRSTETPVYKDVRFVCVCVIPKKSLPVW